MLPGVWGYGSRPIYIYIPKYKTASHFSLQEVPILASTHPKRYLQDMSQDDQSQEENSNINTSNNSVTQEINTPIIPWNKINNEIPVKSFTGYQIRLTGYVRSDQPSR